MGDVLSLPPANPHATPRRITENEATETYGWVMVPLPFDESLSETLASWKEHGLASGHSQRTIEARAYTIQRLSKCGINPLTANREALTEWMSLLTDSRSGQPVERSTKATYRSQLRSFYDWMQDTGRREDDPSAKLPKPRTSAGIPRPLSFPQVEAVLAACSDSRAHQTRAYVILACYEGFRVHEVAKIRGEDIQGAELFVRGKGGKASTVPLHPKVLELASSMPATGWWFPTGSESGHVHRCSVSSAIKRAMIRAGVPGTPHACRHFYGTQVLKATGGNLRLTQRAMRHSSPSTTAIYTQIADDELFRAVSGIPA